MKDNHTQTLKKRFYVLLALAVVAVLGAALTIHRMTNDLTRDLTRLAPKEPTTAAQQDLFDEPDPRATEQLTMPTETPTEADTTTTRPTTIAPTTATPTTAQAAAATPSESYRLPLDGTKVSKDYSPTVPVFSKTMGDWRVHGGIDFAANAGDKVYAVGSGVVTKVTSDSNWGYVIEVDHGSFTARYCALEQGTTVSIGTAVRQGDVLGTIAVSPLENADGCHLHLECRRSGALIDPMEVLADAEN